MRRPARLLYLSPVALDSFAQRPHHFVHWFHHHFDAPVLWLDPGPARFPRLSDWRRLLRPARPALGPPWRHEPWLRHVQARVWPLEPWALGRALNRSRWRPVLQQVDSFMTPDTWIVIGKPCALALALSERYPQAPFVMDAMDAMPAFCEGSSRRWMEQAEQAIAQRATVIFASSTALARRYAAHASKVRTVLNGLTPFEPAFEQILPEPTGHGRQLVLGYVGSIERWFDWASVVGLARACPQCHIEVIGPLNQPAPQPLPANVHLHPPIAQHQVYSVLQRFDIGLIPFLRDDLTDCVDPVKYYEYRAVGLPVLSTRFGQMAERGWADGVTFIDDRPTWSHHDLRVLTQNRLSPDQVAAFRRANEWARRFEAGCAGLVDQAEPVASPTTPPAVPDQLADSTK